VIIDYWPLFGLRVRTPRLELRLPTDEDLAELARVAVDGIYKPGERPFFSRWAEQSPAEVARTVIQGQWRKRGAWAAADWVLELAVFDHDGRPLGTQELRAENFAELREVASSSWLGAEHQGRGLGTEMRSAVLHLAFAGLGADYALSASFADNAASQSISRKLGYRPDGIRRDARDGEILLTHRFRLSREQWDRTDRPEITIAGLEPCLSLFGASSEGPEA
jgi:RimJ/RimL family protein N-acetyltransferase